MFFGHIIHLLFAVFWLTVIQIRADEISSELSKETFAELAREQYTDFKELSAEFGTKPATPTFTTESFTKSSVKLITKPSAKPTTKSNTRCNMTMEETTGTQITPEEVTESYETTFYKPHKTRPPEDDLAFLNNAVYCKFQKNAYVCAELRPQRKYYFDMHSKQCLRFDFGHCKHSHNMFDGKRECMEACEDDYSHAIPNVTDNVYCRFQPDFGECNSYHPMWYFDITEMRCKGFSFSGCGGNNNRFQTVEQCLSVCAAAVRHY